jgi:transcription antitermination factor NusG
VWRAVYSQSRTELAVRDELLERGVRAFCPFETITERRTVRRRTGLTKVVTYDRPLFSRYLFAEAEDVRVLLETRGVEGVLCGAGGHPLTIPLKGRFLELMSIAGSGSALSKTDLTRLSTGFHGQPGDLFEFILGPFEGYQGKIATLDRLDTHGEIDVSFKIFGVERKIAVHHQSVGHIVSVGEGVGGSRITVAAGAR